MPLSQIILEPAHSLEKQAWQPQELREAKLNADGFGLAWYNSQSSAPQCYRHILPIWNDPNLTSVAQSVQRLLFLAMVRSATPGLGVNLQNTQPFCYQQWAFMHNGYILDFHGPIQHRLQACLSDEYLQLIHGQTDSELIFALLMQALQQHSAPDAIKICLQTITDIIGDKRALLNILFSDGENIYACRHAINGLSPTLYYAKNNHEFSDQHQILASEKLNEDESWQSIDEHKIVILKNTQEMQLIDL